MNRVVYDHDVYVCVFMLHVLVCSKIEHVLLLIANLTLLAFFLGFAHIFILSLGKIKSVIRGILGSKKKKKSPAIVV